MKLLVFAHTPPPHHGQSYMVHLMVAGFGGDQRGNRNRSLRQDISNDAPGKAFEVDCYHVNARLSRKLEEIGDFRPAKFLLLLSYCLQAIWCRFRYNVSTLYYIPAPGKRSAVYRDWLVMFVCRPFFKKVILHWHAAGLGKWLETSVQMRYRSITYRALRKVDLSIVLSRFNRADAEKIFSRNVRVVSNGIPDPCPDFETNLLPQRKLRFAARRKLVSGQELEPEDFSPGEAGDAPNVVRILYLAHCTREKGIFDTLEGISLARNRMAERGFRFSLKLWIAGTFIDPREKLEFDRIVSEHAHEDFLQYFGFVSGAQKIHLLRNADLFCFPTYYENENQPVNLIEAMAFGLPILTTRWRSIPELFPADYPGLVDVRSPEQIANVLPALVTGEAGDGFRQIFLRNFTLSQHLSFLSEAFHDVENSKESPSASPSPHPVPAS